MSRPLTQRVAILLCAGYGTRMGALTRTVPKPLLPVADRPVLDYLLDQLLSLSGMTEIHVVSNHHYAAAFEAWAEGRRAECEAAGRRLRVHDDGTLSNSDRLGAIGDLGFVLGRCRESSTGGGDLPSIALVCAGDNILRFSLDSLWEASAAARSDEGSATTTVLAMEENDPQRLRRTGVLELAADGRVRKLWEKPENPPSNWSCPSFYLLNRQALAAVGPYLDDGRPSDEIGRFIGFLAERQTVRALPVQGSRLHVGNPEELRRADEILRREPTLMPIEASPANVG